jgi:hypothetical protein
VGVTILILKLEAVRTQKMYYSSTGSYLFREMFYPPNYIFNIALRILTDFFYPNVPLRILVFRSAARNVGFPMFFVL